LTNKNLLASLENEERKYQKLESKYFLLLKTMELAPQKYKQDLASLADKHESEVNTLKKIMLEKTEDSIFLNKKLAQSHENHKKSVMTAANRIQKMQEQITKLRLILDALRERLGERNSELEQIKSAEKLLLEQKEELQNRCTFLEKSVQETREDSEDMTKLVEIQQESLRKKDNLIQSQSSTIKQLQAQAEKDRRFILEQEERIEKMVEVEKGLADQCEMGKRREEHLNGRIGDISNQLEKANSDIARLRQMETQYQTDIQNNKRALDSAHLKVSDLSSTLLYTDDRVKSLEREHVTKEKEADELNQYVSNLSQECSSLREQLNTSNTNQRSLDTKSNDLASQNQSLSKKLQMTQAELANTKLHMDDVFNKLQKELSSKVESESAIKRKLHEAQGKIAELQESLDLTRIELSSHKELEGRLRSSLEEKQDLHSRMHEQMSQLSKDHHSEKERRSATEHLIKSERELFEKKVHNLRASKDEEIKDLISRIHYKETQLLEIQELVGNLKRELTESKSCNVRLETKIRELLALEEEHQAQEVCFQ
jgi:chromosome segregation ATPase